ncbi:MAG: nucleotidyltransferase family protein, partial [Candidatus Aenigmarchaeota archaeon]|nr:nucleotidyltransferase family protein [Candidatus Aenigmarchaeota archaeon]MDI6722355.1 nucleotidyltransferase family protein [Candidatus Aenigmarchaeota archaeon]
MIGIIVAGGKGTRLLPLTTTTPKVMMEVGGRPVLEHMINLMKSHGIEDIIITTQHLPDRIHSYFFDGKDLGVNILYVVEKEPLGNAGCIKSLENIISDTFAVANGDNLTDANLTEMIKFHREKNSVATIGTYREKESPRSKGIIEADASGKIISFAEKPDKPKSDLAN